MKPHAGVTLGHAATEARINLQHGHIQVMSACQNKSWTLCKHSKQNNNNNVKLSNFYI